MSTLSANTACGPEESIRSHYRGSEPPYDCGKLNSGPLEGQSVLLTTESSHLSSPTTLDLKIYYRLIIRETIWWAQKPIWGAGNKEGNSRAEVI